MSAAEKAIVIRVGNRRRVRAVMFALWLAGLVGGRIGHDLAARALSWVTTGGERR